MEAIYDPERAGDLPFFTSNDDVRAFVRGNVDPSCFELKLHQYLDYVVLSELVARVTLVGQVVTYFSEYGIWPYSENRFLIDMVGERLIGRSMRGVCILSSPNDLEPTRTILQIGLQSGWGGICASSDRNWFWFNHDGLGAIRSTSDVSHELDRIHGVKFSPISLSPHS